MSPGEGYDFEFAGHRDKTGSADIRAGFADSRDLVPPALISSRSSPRSILDYDYGARPSIKK